MSKLDAISIGSNSMTIYDIRSSWVFRTSLRLRDFMIRLRLRD